MLVSGGKEKDKHKKTYYEAKNKKQQGDKNMLKTAKKPMSKRTNVKISKTTMKKYKKEEKYLDEKIETLGNWKEIITENLNMYYNLKREIEKLKDSGKDASNLRKKADNLLLEVEKNMNLLVPKVTDSELKVLLGGIEVWYDELVLLKSSLKNYRRYDKKLKRLKSNVIYRELRVLGTRSRIESWRRGVHNKRYH